MMLAFCLGLLIGLQLTIALSMKPIHWMDSKAANIMLSKQIVVYTISYFLLVLGHKSVEKSQVGSAVLLILFAFLNLVCFFRLVRKSLKGNELEVKKSNAKAVLKILVMIWYGLFMTLCGTNYIMVVLFPGSYTGISTLTFVERAFNVVYYSFSVMFTYSGNGIVAEGILAKSLEIVEVLCCYLAVGIALTSAMGKVSDAKNE